MFFIGCKQIPGLWKVDTLVKLVVYRIVCKLLLFVVQSVRPGKVKSLRVEPVPENYSISFAYFKAPQRESIIYNISTSCQRGLFQTVSNTGYFVYLAHN